VDVQTVTITLDHTNDLNSPTCNHCLRDVFIKLPTGSRGRLVTVRQQAGNHADLILSAWRNVGSPGPELTPISGNNGPDHCSRGRSAVLKFVAPADQDAYIMAETAIVDQGPVRLRVTWSDVPTP
jgi:hypothetical protein